MPYRLKLLCATLLAVGSVAHAQDASVGDALRAMATAASDVFVGQVVSVMRTGGVVEIAFRVDSTVSGAAAGTYTLREWAGLWPPGMQRYHVGERAMVFAHARSAAGLNTPVNGAEGLVPVVPVRGGSPVLDVTRLESRVVRSVTAPLAAEQGSAIALSDAIALLRGRQLEPRRLPLPIHHPLPVRAGNPLPLPIELKEAIHDR